jgi:hypothetical protein
LAEEFSFHSLCSDHASEKKPGLVFSYRRVVAVVQTKIQYDACLPFPSNKLIEVFWQNGRLDRAPLRNMLGSQKSLGKEDQRGNFSQFFFLPHATETTIWLHRHQNSYLSARTQI